MDDCNGTERALPPDGGGPYVGVDGTRGRWVAIAIDREGAFQSAAVCDGLEEVLAAHGGADAFGIDVPLGMPESGPRAADAAARVALGARRATIFMTPPRAVLEAPTYAEARVRATELTGKSISAQSYALRHNVLEADGLRADPRVFEVHPELAFGALAGQVLLTGKRSWNGASERRDLLAAAGLELPSDLRAAGMVPVDDVLDAAAAAWSARRIARGEADRVPEVPELDEHRRPVAIWY
jgi:predicted RNase H-like nuclease